jgi:hypothetical protein
MPIAAKISGKPDVTSMTKIDPFRNIMLLWKKRVKHADVTAD